ncbi:LysR family transcriptional regulator [Paracoccus seriniphilus]|uniref:DNA-binding transcriptional regulator, LysR family n=2 Tax=Paracoccus seriniphilus TaxID=184748 RepID=A0A239PUG6_9RHOB|nr:LysR family transcriptional regulator [Paracoccus seriniphilus]WCR15452.1 LysR family transcriptional regulator [Paracoccus seriniphilus]SNT73944.1 DNA-binding transcriptional regulator, LysR family [Paracoccus seriniphilus]
MKIEAIDIFNELVRSGSIRQAAEGLNTSPTAVVRQLDKLEHSFGTPLVERTPRGIRLTAAGEVLAASTSRVAQELKTAHQLIDDYKGLRRGRVAIHTNGAAASAILAPALSEFSRSHPEISMEVNVSSAQGALDAVAEGRSQFSVTMFAPKDPRVEVLFRAPVYHEPIMSPDHPLAARVELSMADLIRHRLALPNRSFGMRRAFDARLHDLGLPTEDYTFTTPSLEMQIELALRCSAILILPRMTVARWLDMGQFVCRPFVKSEKIISWLELSHANSRTQSIAARRFRDFLMGFLGRRLSVAE